MGDYQLILESYDLDSDGVESTLKTDTIQVSVTTSATYERTEVLVETIEIPMLLNSTLVVKQIYPS